MLRKRAKRLTRKDQKLNERIVAGEDIQRHRKRLRQEQVNEGLFAQEALVLNGDPESYERDCFD